MITITVIITITIIMIVTFIPLIIMYIRDMTVLIAISTTTSRRNLRWTPHPVIVTIADSTDYIRILLSSDYTTILGCC